MTTRALLHSRLAPVLAVAALLAPGAAACPGGQVASGGGCVDLGTPGGTTPGAQETGLTPGLTTGLTTDPGFDLLGDGGPEPGSSEAGDVDAGVVDRVPDDFLETFLTGLAGIQLTTADQELEKLLNDVARASSAGDTAAVDEALDAIREFQEQTARNMETSGPSA